MDELNKMTMEIFTKLEHQWLSTTTTAATKKTKILTIDGGGASTSITVAGQFLIHLEQSIQSKTSDSGARISDYFDVISGTGIGALLAVLLSISDSTSSGRPLFSAKEAVTFLTNNRENLFKRRRDFVLRRGNHRYSTASLAKALKKVFGTKTLKDSRKPILIPCYDTMTSSPFVFSRAASIASNLDFNIWKVCCAAIATPSLFKPFEITSVDEKTRFTAIDGGLVMNNPAVTAVTHVVNNKVDFPGVNGVEDILLLSIGNGMLSCRGSSGKWSGSSGKVVETVVDVSGDGVSEMVDQMLGNAFSWNRNDYVRIQANGIGGTGLMTMEEVLKEKGIESLPFGGKRLLTETNGDRIDNFVQRLVAASPKNSLPPSPHKPPSPLHDGR